MTITEKEVNGISVIQIEGKLDINTFDILENKLNGLLEKGIKKLLVDCTGLTFISSTGLRILIMAQKKLSAVGGVIGLFGLNETTRKIFDITVYDKLFPIFNDEASAVKEI
ncbi:MAG TPA: STAS domain-containing protein [Ignavibacteriaceae bacterium]|nr:STAS domain-containing protein [Ignavibacteriaceae bacterium]